MAEKAIDKFNQSSNCIIGIDLLSDALSLRMHLRRVLKGYTLGEIYKLIGSDNPVFGGTRTDDEPLNIRDKALTPLSNTDTYYSSTNKDGTSAGAPTPPLPESRLAISNVFQKDMAEYTFYQ